MTFHREKERPLVWAHRGASAKAPENTMAAFRLAAEMKADGIELDVQLTRDEKLVVIHDEWIDRTSDGTGWVKDYTLEELRGFHFNRLHPECPDDRIPTLEEVYDLAKRTGMTVNVELKTGIVFYHDIEEKVTALTRAMGMEEQVLYSSFNHRTCVRLRQLVPEAYIGFLYQDGAIDMAEYCRRHGGSALHPALYNLQYPGFMQEAAQAGLDVNVWTVNKTEHLRQCIAMGVNAVITNVPDRALKVCAERCPDVTGA